MGDPQPMNRLINWTLTDLMLQHSEVVMMGEDIGRKGGAYGITQKLLQGFGSGTDLAIVTYGNGRCLSSQAQAKLEAKGGNTRIIDLRWLAPLPIEAVLEATKGCNHVLIVDECRSTGSRSEALMALFAERSKVATACHVAGDCFIATGPAYAASLPSKDSIISAALALVQVDG